MAVMSRDIRRSFDITGQTGLLAPRSYPTIAGTKTLTLDLSRIAVEKAKDPKELFTIEGTKYVAFIRYRKVCVSDCK